MLNFVDAHHCYCINKFILKVYQSDLFALFSEIHVKYLLINTEYSHHLNFKPVTTEIINISVNALLAALLLNEIRFTASY